MLDVEDNLLKARGNVLTKGEADELLEIIQEMNVMIENSPAKGGPPGYLYPLLRKEAGLRLWLIDWANLLIKTNKRTVVFCRTN